MDKKKAGVITSLNLDEGRSYAQQFYETALVWDKPTGYNNRKYYHAKLSFDPADNAKYGGRLTPKGAARIGWWLAQEFWPGHEVLIVVHLDKKHLHVHFIINAVSLETGRMLHISDREYREQKDRANGLAAEYGLSTLDWRKATKDKRKTEREGSTAYADTVAEVRIRERGGAVWKDELREIIDEARAGAKSHEAFAGLLAERGVTLSRSAGKAISYIYGAHRAVRGNRLGEAYTAENIKAALTENREAEHPALDALIGRAEKENVSLGRIATHKQLGGEQER